MRVEGRGILSACLLCGSNQTRPFLSVQDYEYQTLEGEYWNYSECQSCDTISLLNKPERQLADIYPPNYYSYQLNEKSIVWRCKGRLDDLRLRRLAGLIARSELNVLDVGGGNGWVASRVKFAIDSASEVGVLEWTEYGREYAESKGLHYWTDPEQIPSGLQFHLVLMLSVIEHVADPVNQLKRIRQLLSDDGIVVVQTPNVDCLERRIARHSKYWGVLHAPRHWMLFSERGIRLIAEKAGFEVISLRYIQGGVFNAWSIMAFLSRCRLVRISKDRAMYEHFLTTPLAIVFSIMDLLRAKLFKTSQMSIVLKPSAASLSVKDNG